MVNLRFALLTALVHRTTDDQMAAHRKLDLRRDDPGAVESHMRAFLVSHRNRRKIQNTTFLGCEAFSLTSRKDVNGHQKGQAQFVGGYLSLLEPR
jgi:hypothetical protein